ncbi:GNAT family N-acetyltransferase [Streptomyces sp. TRM 70351]|uniref:GNAT family N-acetyltransferase n=1 Tax=Streptomyces sp. TRM 70351 TaxID=3116552 RepID=UPI002E7C4E87|nr:GNAT family N-acetyltransferase [Streptomyces sp. TRM 70351]MEE1930239.1 GNAT family N-acetyltransferase [Streptomyces sp. TRM 70351]
MSVLVRRAVAADARELARMRQLSLTCPEEPWTRPRDLPDGPWVEECREAFAAMLDDRDTVAAFVVDAAPGRVAACALGFLLPRVPGPDSSKPFNGDISTVATDPAFRRRGYARAVVTALMDWMTVRGCKRISLTASSEGEPLYASLGFTTDEPRMSRPAE